MRKLPVVLILVFAVANGLPAYADEIRPPPDIRKIKERGKLVVAQYSGVQPGFFAFDDSKEYPDQACHMHMGRRMVGCDIALAMKIARTLGVELELDRSPKDFDSVCRRVASGKADIAISKISATVERAQYLRFTSPYAVLRMGILVDRVFASQDRSADSVIDRCNRPGVRIAVWEASSYMDFAREVLPDAHLVPYPGLEPMLKAVLNGEVRAVFNEEFETIDRLHRDPRLAVQLRFVPVPGKEDPIAIAVSPASPNLLAFLNLFLKYEHVSTVVRQSLRYPAVKSLGQIQGRRPRSRIGGAGNSVKPVLQGNRE